MVSLIRDEKIVTTLARAKEIQPRVERLITIAKRDSVASRRLVAARLGNPSDALVSKFFSTIAPRFADRAGGYTRVVKLGNTSPGRTEAVIAFVA
jgi:large subunit ribosomal protein L17